MTIFCIAVVLIIAERTLKTVKDEGAGLKMQLQALQGEKIKSEKHQALLIQQINSQSDPAWIELVLKRELGLIPEGQKKVVFIPK